MTLAQQTAIMDKCYRLITAFQHGKPPRGIVAPWWESSRQGTELMLRYGLSYDHSFSHHDCQPYYLRTGDSWTAIDYEQHPREWMKPLTKGQVTGLVEIPASWYKDDLPPLVFIKGAPNSHGWVSTRVLEEMWLDQFAYYYREEEDGFVMPITIHPDACGHPHALLMLER